MDYNIKIKNWHDGSKDFICYSNSIQKTMFNDERNLEKEFDKNNVSLENRLKSDEISIDEYMYLINKSKKNSCRRSLNMIYDISRCNDWDYFVTLTFDPDKVNSFDYSACTSKVSNFLIVARRNNPNIKYLGVPEKHKSGRFHFHFLFSNCPNFDFVDSGKKTKRNEIIYNVDNYNWGWSTATIIKDSVAVGRYIGKYITKDLSSVTPGKKKYWASRNVDRPQVEEILCYDLDNYIKNLSSDPNLTYSKTNEYEYESLDGELKKSFIKYFQLKNDI